MRPEPKRFALTPEAKAEIDALLAAQQQAEAVLRLAVRVAQKTLGIDAEYRYLIDEGVFIPPEEPPEEASTGVE